MTRTHSSMRSKVRRAESHQRMVAEIKRIMVKSIADTLYRPLAITSFMERQLGVKIQPWQERVMMPYFGDEHLTGTSLD